LIIEFEGKNSLNTKRKIHIIIIAFNSLYLFIDDPCWDNPCDLCERFEKGSTTSKEYVCPCSKFTETSSDAPQCNYDSRINTTMPEISLSLTFLNDNNLLASSFEDNTIRFANINEASLNSISFNNSKILQGHKHFIKVITALNKTILASGSCDNTIILWDILTFTQINNLKGHTGCVNALISIPYGDSSSNLLISGSSDTKIKVWESNGKQLTSIAFENKSPVNALAYGVLDNYAYIASASDEKIVKIWSQTDLAYENEIIKDIKGINFLTVLNKTQIVTVNSSNVITIWNSSASKPIITFQSETPINAIKALSNGNLILIGLTK
jgi:WD40 repeat protein